MKDLKFSSLFREFISLIIVACSILKGGSLPVFVPFQGIHFFNITVKTYNKNTLKLFSSLFREFISLMIYLYLTNKVYHNVFVPFQGIHFFNSRWLTGIVPLFSVFVPFQGIHFFNKWLKTTNQFLTVFVPFQGIHFFNLGTLTTG